MIDAATIGMIPRHCRQLAKVIDETVGAFGEILEGEEIIGPIASRMTTTNDALAFAVLALIDLQNEMEGR